MGWLARYPNCCTSYPAPLKLVVLTASRTRTFTGNGLPLWRWSFQDGGALVALRQQTVHFGGNPDYELREIASGCLVAEYDLPVDRDNRPLPGAEPPRWVADLDR